MTDQAAQKIASLLLIARRASRAVTEAENRSLGVIATREARLASSRADAALESALATAEATEATS
jgi:hypothetical protein